MAVDGKEVLEHCRSLRQRRTVVSRSLLQCCMDRVVENRGTTGLWTRLLTQCGMQVAPSRSEWLNNGIEDGLDIIFLLFELCSTEGKESSQRKSECKAARE